MILSVNHMVITQKPNCDLRICLDPKDLNRLCYEAEPLYHF